MSLLLGLCAALLWAFHDLCVRYVTQQVSVLPALLTVLVCGALIVLPVAVVLGDWQAMTATSYGLSALSGVAFAGASLSLYGAFANGPVRLVAPIIGAYPVLSVGWGVMTGTEVTPHQWGAVLIIIAGVALVAILSNDTRHGGQKIRAVIFAVCAGTGFALTFAFAQAAIQHGSDLPVIVATRAAALAVVGLILLATRQGYRPRKTALPLLAGMGFLDATALALVTVAGTQPHPEFAAVSSSLFGLLTVVLAWAILKEPMTRQQWGAAVMVFGGIGYLGF